MSDGYELEELARIEAALDDLVSPTSEDVFQATRPYDERAIASVAAARAGGAGSVTDGVTTVSDLSSLRFLGGTVTDLGGGEASVVLQTRLVGPIPFAFDTAGIDTDGAVVHAISSGTVVTKWVVVITQTWDGAGTVNERFLTMGLAPADDPTAWVQSGQTQDSRIGSSPSPSSGAVQDGELLVNEFPTYCGEDAVAVVFSEPSGMTQGAGVLYLLVAEPVAS